MSSVDDHKRILDAMLCENGVKGRVKVIASNEAAKANAVVGCGERSGDIALRGAADPDYIELIRREFPHN